MVSNRKFKTEKEQNMANVFVTVNGKPLSEYISEERGKEIREFRRSEVAPVRSHIVTKRIRNHSGARSGKCRIIFSKGA